jgi:hypothetical protein
VGKTHLSDFVTSFKRGTALLVFKYVSLLAPHLQVLHLLGHPQQIHHRPDVDVGRLAQLLVEAHGGGAVEDAVHFGGQPLLVLRAEPQVGQGAVAADQSDFGGEVGSLPLHGFHALEGKM